VIQVSVILVQNSLVSKRYLETIKALDGKLYHLEYHQERLNTTLQTNKTHNLSTLLDPPRDGLYRCRVLYDADTIKIEYIPYIKRHIRSLKLLTSETLEYAKKYEDREDLNRLFEKREGCDDILVVKNALVSDTSIANIAFYDGEQWVTPKTPLLYGTTRKRYLETGKIVEKEITVLELKRYKKVALMNAMIDFDIIAEENIGDIIC